MAEQMLTITPASRGRMCSSATRVPRTVPM